MEETMTLARAADMIIVGTFCVVCFSVTFYAVVEIVFDAVESLRKKLKERKAKKAAAPENTETN